MTNLKYHSPEFEYDGISIPKFDLEPGKLIRLCLPNSDAEGNSLVHRFRMGLLNHFERSIPKAKWAKEYKDPIFRKYLKPMTVENYIITELNTGSSKAKTISEDLELNPKDKLRDLVLGKRKALAIKCDFEKYNTVVFDYYGVGANDFEYLERIVDSEITKGKCGIAMDRLEFNQNTEKYTNIEQIRISLGNKVYKPKTSNEII